MKKIVLTLLISFLFISCWPTTDINEIRRQEYKAVIVDRATLESSTALLNAQPTIKAGKIYIKDNLMLINDVNKGFHVYDYTDAKNPVRLYFIKAPGATDLAIKGNAIYINQAVDLLTTRFNLDTKAFIVTNRNRNVFPQKQAPNGLSSFTEQNQIIIDWTLIK